MQSVYHVCRVHLWPGCFNPNLTVSPNTIIKAVSRHTQMGWLLAFNAHRLSATRRKLQCPVAVSLDAARSHPQQQAGKRKPRIKLGPQKNREKSAEQDGFCTAFNTDGLPATTSQPGAASCTVVW
jgi:hypothetical protein